MTSSENGVNTTGVRILEVSQGVLLLLAKRKEYWLRYDEYPEFLHARLHEILDLHLEDDDIVWPGLGLRVSLELLGQRKYAARLG